MSKLLSLSLCLFLVIQVQQTFAQKIVDGGRISNSQFDKLAIQESIAGYLIAINERDAKLAASFWSETGEWIAEDGTRVRGTSNIAVALEDSFDNDPQGMNVALRNLTIRLVSPTVAIEDGLAVISIPDEEETEATYSVVHVKTNSGWKIDTVRETQTPTAPARPSQLESLSWMVGDWTDQLDDNIQVETSCQWTAGNNSLRRSFSVTENGQVKKHGTQLIVWDARLGKIRSWVFDSEGGFGNGIWEQKSQSSWVVDAEFQLADGGVATAANIYSGITEAKFDFQSVDRTIDGIAIESTPVVSVVKTKQEEISQNNSANRNR